ncbi:hypothetical protein BDN70DRAFT_257853 [Pholiota conissans]|uniref:Uncharacterized protein n=1 Tax=Pholiota conissans TaxID=109636 RepID=A0A9P6CQ19_9AGAR|nr:hypothetical protein BDN70DRAFT_257853 [Pholiota conissans]
MQTADSYDEASHFAMATVSTAASYHARFLRSLVEHDIFKSRRGERERGDNMPIDPRLQGAPAATAHTALQQATSATATVSAAAAAAAAAQAYAHQVHNSRMQDQPPVQYNFPASPHLPAHPQAQSAAPPTVVAPPPPPDYQGDIQARSLGNAPAAPGHAQYPGGYIPPAPATTELDQRYWKNMFIELGFGENDGSVIVMNNGQPQQATPQQQQMYMEQQQQQQQQHQRHASFGGQVPSQYQPMHAASTQYGH